MKKVIVAYTFWFAFMLILLTPLATWAQTYGATAILKIKPGSLSTGMGQAGVALHQNAYSMWWNPALLAGSQGIQAGGTKVEVIPDLTDGTWYNNAACSVQLHNLGSIGFSFMHLTYGKSKRFISKNRSSEGGGIATKSCPASALVRAYLLSTTMKKTTRKYG